MKEYVAEFAVVFIFALWERWLGKNKNIKENSTLELIENTLKGIIK